MNYIKLLNAAFEKFFSDDRLNPTHICLYMSLFQEWNSSRFANEFYVNRRDLMFATKIGSKTTYHRCITDLNSWGYLSYFPSNNPYKGSKVSMTIIETSDEPPTERYDPLLEQLAGQYNPIREPVVYPHRPFSGQALVSTINNTKQVNNNKLKLPKNENEVLDFFKKQNWSAMEAEKFFNHYSSIGWKVGGKIEMVNWHSTAKNWILKADEIKKEKTAYKPSQKQDNLHTTRNKDYGQPL